MKISLIVTTYNWPDALELVLVSILRQTRKPDELVIADDGSRLETSQVIQGVLRTSGLRWRHVWHSDCGVRQSRIKNLAVRNSTGDYLIFVDHDVVLHKDFVFDHSRMAGEGLFLQGKRCLLSEEYTGRVLSTKDFVSPPFWAGGLGNRKNTLRLPLLGRGMSRTKRFESSLRGCNLSMFRRDFLGVDGFDEIFDGSWGREDSDICYRLFHNGVRVRDLWYMAVQYHLCHPVTRNWERERLDGELLRNVHEKRKKAIRGFSQLSEEGGIVASSSA
jgi:hypothetical protein